MNNENKISERERIAERLKEARVLSGLSQESAANFLGVQRPAISEIEAGRRKVSAEEIIQFSNLYRVGTSWLLLNDEDGDGIDEQLKVAARELGKMNEEDRKKLLDILKVLPNRK